MDTSNPTPKKRRSFFSPRRAVGRFSVSLALGVLVFAMFTPKDVEWWMRAILGWDVMALTLVTLTWIVILRANNAETKRRASADDPGRHVVFGIAVLSSLFSFFAAAFVLRHVKALPGPQQLPWTLLTLGAIVLSWFLAHTAYTMRYAHLFYRKGLNTGMQFPGNELPSDIDFAYFSFTLGMCFQVSDVVVTTTRCRRAVLLHAMLSFVYNTAILALALNLVFGAMT